MPFWKQSEDPWDRKPDKPRREPKEPQANPLDSLKAWNEERKAKAKEREEAKRLPPEPCPWCGKEMERGCLAGSRGVYWYPGLRTASAAWWGPGAIEESFQVDDEGDFLQGTYKTAWYCRSCKKMVFSMAFAAAEAPPPQTGGECTAELEGYFRDAQEDEEEAPS